MHAPEPAMHPQQHPHPHANSSVRMQYPEPVAVWPVCVFSSADTSSPRPPAHEGSGQQHGTTQRHVSAGISSQTSMR